MGWWPIAALSGLPTIGIKLRRSTSNLTVIPLRSSFTLGKVANEERSPSWKNKAEA